MVAIDQFVLLGVLLGTAVFAVALWWRGERGRHLAEATWLAFYGLVLVVMMAAHSGEILYHTLRGGLAIDGSAWAYNFRVYALQLLGAVLIWQGVACLRAASRLGRGDLFARKEARRATLIVLALVIPLIPIHSFFGYLISGLSAVTVLVIAISAAKMRAAHPLAT